MKYFKSAVAAVSLALVAPTTANAQLFGGLDNNTVLAGGTGAGLGALAGSRIAPRGNRTEGAAIGALVGGLGGAAYGNSRSRYGGDPYAGQFNPGFNGRNLIGTGTGAVIGGAIGSNIARSGRRQEGAAIGAVLGGAAGYALVNRGQQQFRGQQFRQPVGYNPQPVYTGQTVTQTYRSAPTHHVQQQVQYVPNVTVAAPNLRLAGPPLQEQVFYNNRVRIEQLPIARAEHYSTPTRTVYQSPHIPSTTYTVQQPTYQAPVQQPVYQQSVQPAAPATLCYAGSSKRYDSWGRPIKKTSC